MNGEVKSYRLNEPMRWSEFKSMPDDVRVIYIQAIRQKYGVSDSQIAKMLGAAQTSFSKEVIRLGINFGRRCKNSVVFDKEAWIAWCNGITPIPVKGEFVDQAADEPEAEVQEEAAEEITFAPKPVEEVKVIPRSGNMVFEGRVEDIMRSVETILGGAKVHISITWDVAQEGEIEDA